MKQIISQFTILIFCIFIFSTLFSHAQSEKPAPPKMVEFPENKTSESDDEPENEIYKINPTPDESSPSKVYIPKNLEDSFAELKKMLHPEFIKNFREKDDVSDQHFGLGLWMRNNWGLWGGSRLAKYFNEIGINHPDDMSGIILSNFRLHLNEKPLEVEKQVAYYKEYWRQTADPPKLGFPQCKAGIKQEGLGNLIEETEEKMPRIIHYGYCKSNNKLWAFEHGKGWYLPDSDLTKKIEEPDFPLPEFPIENKNKP